MKIRIITLLALCVATLGSVKAQIRLDPYYPYSKWTAGAGLGFSTLYGNLDHSNSEPVFRLNAEYNLNAWTYVDLEFQHGAFSDYESRNSWTNGINAYNKFSAFDLSLRMSMGQLFKYPRTFFAKTIFGIYGGVGVGYMFNNVSNISRKFKKTDKYLITDYNPNNIKTSSSNFFLPLTIGWNLHLTRRTMFNFNYQFSYAFSDYLDGYNFQQPTATNRYNCMFSVMSFGLNFYIGQVGSVRDPYNVDRTGAKKKK